MVVAEAVARQAIADGVSDLADPETLKDQIEDYVWEPEYLPYEHHALAWIKSEE
jgi:malic enzyme